MVECRLGARWQESQPSCTAWQASPPSCTTWQASQPSCTGTGRCPPAGCAASCRWCWPGTGKSAPPAASRSCLSAPWAAPGRSCSRGGGRQAGNTSHGWPSDAHHWAGSMCRVLHAPSRHIQRCARSSSAHAPEVWPPRKVQHHVNERLVQRGCSIDDAKVRRLGTIQESRREQGS